MCSENNSATQRSIAQASTEQLLQELIRRKALVRCQSSILMDGRDCQKSRDAGITDRQIAAHLEVRALEFISRGMATADPADRVHHFSIEPAHGDYSPGSVVATVEMLAVNAVLK